MDDEELEELREDVANLANVVQHYAQVLSAVVRALEKHNIDITGIKLPTLN